MTEPKPTHLTHAELDELERLEKKASPGEWHTESVSEQRHRWNPHNEPDPDDEDCAGIKDGSGTEIVTTDSGYYGPRMNDARLIAAARNSLPQLIAMARTLLLVEKHHPHLVRNVREQGWLMQYIKERVLGDVDV